MCYRKCVPIYTTINTELECQCSHTITKISLLDAINFLEVFSNWIVKKEHIFSYILVILISSFVSFQPYFLLVCLYCLLFVRALGIVRTLLPMLQFFLDFFYLKILWYFMLYRKFQFFCSLIYICIFFL